MKRTTRLLLIVSAVALLFSTVACDLTPKAPKTGTITNVTPDSAACYDEQSDSGQRRSVAVEYRPAGTDKNNQPWPLTFACVTPDDAVKYRVEGQYP